MTVIWVMRVRRKATLIGLGTFAPQTAKDSKVAGVVEDEGDFGDYRGGGDNGIDNDDDDDDCIRNLCAVDSKVAGAVEDYQEMGERSTDCHFRAPYVDS